MGRDHGPSAVEIAIVGDPHLGPGLAEGQVAHRTDRAGIEQVGRDARIAQGIGEQPCIVERCAPAVKSDLRACNLFPLAFFPSFLFCKLYPAVATPFFGVWEWARFPRDPIRLESVERGWDAKQVEGISTKNCMHSSH
jgi:hypothetical protein